MITIMVLAASAGATVEVLEQLDAMYSRSLNTMIIYLSVLVLLIAVVIPLMTAFQQRKLFQIEEEKLSQRIQEQVDALRTELLANVGDAADKRSKDVESALGAMRKEVRRKMAFATAGVFFVQGRFNLDRDKCVASTSDFADSADDSLTAGDQVNLQRSLEHLAENCLPKLKATHLESSPEVVKQITDLLDRLERENEGGRFTNYVDRIRKALRDAEKRA